MGKIISRGDARKAIVDEGALLHDNGSPIPKYYVVWGNWDRWKTIRYDSFHAIKDELDLIETRNGYARSYSLVAGKT